MNLSALAQGAEFIIGVWCTNFQNHVIQSGGTWHIQTAEKQQILDLGLNYLIACTDNADVEEAIINFCEEQNGNIKATLERRPSDSFQIWRYSYQGVGVTDPNWQNDVNGSLAELANKFDGSIGLHSILIGAEHNIQDPSRWDEVEFMAQSVNANVPTNPISVTQEGWDPTNSPAFVANIPSNDIYMTGRYVFRADPPTPNSGPDFQSAIDQIVETFSAIIRSIRDNNPNMEFYGIIQTQESPPQGYNFRHPTKEEILLSVNLGLSYGIKGVIYYLYAQAGTETGLLDANRDPTSKYSEVQDINLNYLQVHGTKFLPLTWHEGISVHLETNEPISPEMELYDVTAKEPIPQLLGPPDPEAETYVEVGYLTDPEQRDYYMVVNRRALTGEERDITLTFEKQLNTPYKILDRFTSEKNHRHVRW